MVSRFNARRALKMQLALAGIRLKVLDTLAIACPLRAIVALGDQTIMLLARRALQAKRQNFQELNIKASATNQK